MLICSNCAHVNDDRASNCAQCSTRLGATDFLTDGATEEQIDQRRDRILNPPPVS